MNNKKLLKNKIITIIIVSLFMQIVLPMPVFAEEEETNLTESFAEETTLDESFGEENVENTENFDSTESFEENEVVEEMSFSETDEMPSEAIVDEIVEEPESDKSIEDIIKETSLFEEEEILLEEEVFDEVTNLLEKEDVLDKRSTSSEVEDVHEEGDVSLEVEEIVEKKASPSDIKTSTSSNAEVSMQLNIDVDTLVGTWTIDGITSYRFDIDGNGAMILPSRSYFFKYVLESDKLLLRFENSHIEDIIFIPSIEDDVLILEQKKELGVSKYMLKLVMHANEPIPNGRFVD